MSRDQFIHWLDRIILKEGNSDYSCRDRILDQYDNPDPDSKSTRMAMEYMGKNAAIIFYMTPNPDGYPDGFTIHKKYVIKT